MKARTLISVFAVLLTLAVAASAQSKKCTPIGGVILTDLGVWDSSSTFGYATGDLKGSLGVSILSIQQTGNRNYDPGGSRLVRGGQLHRNALHEVSGQPSLATVNVDVRRRAISALPFPAPRPLSD